MTSTSFNVGLTDCKNSSRVLKPPGGGHSDIFGVRGENEIASTPSKRKNQPQSTIGGCFAHGEVAKSVNKENEKTNTKEMDMKNGNDTTDENTEPIQIESKEEAKKIEETAPPRRVRVPPGGFSSGLW